MSKIKSIVKKKITTEKLYNLSVEKDETFIANGIVVHNCDSYITPIMKGNLDDREIEKLKASKELTKTIQFSDKCVDHCDHKSFLSVK